MKLRPHHLLCTQSYKGMGYNDEFVKNMTAITSHLRYDDNAVIDIVFSTDDICTKCPMMLGEDLCQSNEKVKRFDKKVATFFGIEQRSYNYKDIIQKINAQMTSEIMDDICSECNWYETSDCRKIILGAD